MIALISFAGYGLQYMQRVNMSTAIVCMLNNTALKEIAMAEQLSLGELRALTNETSSFNINPLTNSTADQLDSEPVSASAHCFFQEVVSKKIDTVSHALFIIVVKILVEIYISKGWFIYLGQTSCRPSLVSLLLWLHDNPSSGWLHVYGFRSQDNIGFCYRWWIDILPPFSTCC